MHACMPRRVSLLSVSLPDMGAILRGGRKIEWFNRDHDEYCDGMKRAYKVSRDTFPGSINFLELAVTGRDLATHPLRLDLRFFSPNVSNSCALCPHNSAHNKGRGPGREVYCERALPEPRPLLCALRIYFLYFYLFIPFFLEPRANWPRSPARFVLRCLHLR